MSGYDSEYGKDAWKRYRRMVEANDPAMQEMLHEFGAEQYEQGAEDERARIRAAVEALADPQPDVEYLPVHALLSIIDGTADA